MPFGVVVFVEPTKATHKAALVGGYKGSKTSQIQGTRAHFFY